MVFFFFYCRLSQKSPLLEIYLLIKLFYFIFLRIRKYLSDYSSWVVSSFMALYLSRNIVPLTEYLLYKMLAPSWSTEKQISLKWGFPLGLALRSVHVTRTNFKPRKLLVCWERCWVAALQCPVKAKQFKERIGKNILILQKQIKSIQN